MLKNGEIPGLIKNAGVVNGFIWENSLINPVATPAYRINSEILQERKYARKMSCPCRTEHTGTYRLENKKKTQLCQKQKTQLCQKQKRNYVGNKKRNYVRNKITQLCQKQKNAIMSETKNVRNQNLLSLNKNIPPQLKHI